MKLTIEQITETQKEDKPIVHKVVLKGTDQNLVKITCTIEGELKGDIQKYVPMMVGDARKIEFKQLNKTLDEYEESEMDAHMVEVEKFEAERRARMD